MINFKFVGKIATIKEKENFVPYEEKVFDSGWKRRQLFFSAINGDNRHMFCISGGYFPDRADYKIVTYGPNGKDESGNTIKGERYEIPWKKRNDPDLIAKIAGYKKWVLDLEERGRRTKLQRMADNIHEGESISDEDLKAVGLTDESEVAEALKQSIALKHEYIAEYDFAGAVNKILNSEKYKNKKFYISGSLECQYGSMTHKWYKNMKVQSIYLADDNEEERCEGDATLFFTEGAVDDGSLEENEKYYINAYTFEYDSSSKEKIPCPFQLVVPSQLPNQDGVMDEISEKRAKALVKKFIVESNDEKPVKQFGVDFDFLNGAQKVEITDDMLTDEQKDDLELGLISMDEIRAEMGPVYGKKLTENRFKGIMKGYTKGRKDTAYTPESLEYPRKVDEKEVDDLFGDTDSEDNEDNDEDDLDLGI